MIDSYGTVIRLKGAPVAPVEHFGTRMDYVCARSHLFRRSDVPFWHFSAIEDKWLPLYRKYSVAKPSTGLCAVFCAIEYLGVEEISLIGFDRLLHGKCGKYNKRERMWFAVHDGDAESKCLSELPIKVIDLVRVHEQVC